MSVKELKIITAHGHIINISNKKNEFEFEIDNQDTVIWYWLDRNQAHLLMLYLQEHLK